MPVTRRSSGGGRPSSGKQATLSFNHRVTKSVPKPGKKDPLSAPPAKSPLAQNVVFTDESDADADADVKEEEVEKADVEADEVKAGLRPEQAEPETKTETKTEAELRADKITQRQIGQYWRGIENERRTRRLHQEDLSLSEKILRYWDVSSQYGPCVGITRLKRWQRAEKLGLNPPVEVLAVLLQEEMKDTKGIEKAYMDDILNSTAVGAG